MEALAPGAERGSVMVWTRVPGRVSPERSWTFGDTSIPRRSSTRSGYSHNGGEGWNRRRCCSGALPGRFFGVLEQIPSRVHRVGLFADLAQQLCSWVPGQGESPDRLDALVWAVWALTVEAVGIAWAL